MTFYCDRCGTCLNPDHGYGDCYEEHDLSGDYCTRCGAGIWEQTQTATQIADLLTASLGQPLTAALVVDIMALADPNSLRGQHAEAVKHARRQQRMLELGSKSNGGEFLTDAENAEMIEMTDGKYKPWTKEMQDDANAWDAEMAAACRKDRAGTAQTP